MPEIIFVIIGIFVFRNLSKKMKNYTEQLNNKRVSGGNYTTDNSPPMIAVNNTNPRNRAEFCDMVQRNLDAQHQADFNQSVPVVHSVAHKQDSQNTKQLISAMENRENDWYAKQLRAEKISKYQVDEMFSLKREHADNHGQF
jgi:glycosidase